MQELVRYDAMVNAIAECHRVDEVKDMRDRALALEMYARQARNTDAERKASEVRIRAERRAGELLKEQAENGQRATGRPEKLSQPATLSELGISRTQSSRWQGLADVPSEEFEGMLRDPAVKPTTNGILARGSAPQKLNEDALWFWGRLREYEQRNYFDPDRWDNDEPFHFLLDQMTDAMRSDTYRLIPFMAAFFTACERAIRER
jgi:hypothetical protein